MAVTPGTLAIDEPTTIDKRADTNAMTRSALLVQREVVSIGSPDDTTPEQIAGVTAAGNLQVVVNAALPAGAANIGDVDVLTQPARSHTTDSVRIGDGTDLALVSAAGALNVDGSAVTQPISAASLPLPTGAATAALQLPNSHDVTVDNAAGASAVNIQDGGNSITVDGTVSVTEPVSVDDNAGSLTVDQATAANLLGRMELATRTSGGGTTFHLVSAATTNATVVKASAGQLYGYYIYNSNAAVRKVAFHNSASAPTAGAGIYFTVPIPASSAANCSFEMGIPFSAGIGITTVTGLADSDATAVALNDLVINLWYA